MTAISFVLCWDRQVLKEKHTLERAGVSLRFKSSMVTSACLGSAMVISWRHQVFFISKFTFYGFLMVSQQGPLILRFRMNSSSML
jgi:hypothetical protein